MLIGLGIRDIVLIESLDLAFGPGLTALTGETGAGKSIILDALGLATGGRGDAGLVRRGASQGVATAIFGLSLNHPAWAVLDEKALTYDRSEDLVLRRVLGIDGRSRAFVNDQATSIGVLRELGTLLLEVHGQHETVGLLDGRTHRALLDDFGDCAPSSTACRETWSAWRAARDALGALTADQARSAAETEELTLRLSELDRLAPQEGEEARLAQERAVLGAAEKTLADLASARDHMGEDVVTNRLAQAYRALERARERLVQAAGGGESLITKHLEQAAAATDRALIEATEALAAIDAVAGAFVFDPDQLEQSEARLFALRAMARKLDLPVEGLPQARSDMARRLLALETADEAIASAGATEDAAEIAFMHAAHTLTATRRAAADRLTAAVQAELMPLKLDRARFQVALEPLAADRLGPQGADKVEFQVSTLPGAPFGGLGSIASGGELARFALALKASLAGRGTGPQPLMIFDEVDQGVGGAVADAVGLRLKRLSAGTQVLLVTHSPQVAARGDAHWRVTKAGDGDSVRATVETLGPAAREEEIARMLSGAQITDAARAAARALIHA